MRSFYMISVLLLMFALGLVFGPAVQAEQEKTKEESSFAKATEGKEKETTETPKKETSKDAEIARTSHQSKLSSGQAEQEKTEEVKKGNLGGLPKTPCVVDARNCGLGYTKKMYGVVSLKKIWDGQKQRFITQKVCIVEEGNGKSSVWSFENPGRAIISERERPATKEEIAAEEELMREITGLIIEQTMTKIGYEFYENFFIRWKAPKGVKDYNILINERASPFWGSWVQVDVDTTTVWSKVLKPRSEEIEEAAKQAVEVTKQFLERYEEFKRQLKGPDMMGSGI